MMRDFLLPKWDQVREGLLATIEKFADAELSYRPFPGAYSVAELLLHIAHEEDIEIGHGLTRELTEFPPAYDAAAHSDKAAIIAVLNKTHAGTAKYLQGLDDAALGSEIETPWGATFKRIDLFWHVLEHEVHHRAELSLILGLLGREGLDA